MFATDHAWTPATYRVALDAWRRNAPKHDSDIFEEASESERPRHRSLARVLAPLLKFRSPPSAETGSNWSLTAANDRPADFDAEAVHEVVPSVPRIMREIKAGPVVHAPHGPVESIGSLRFSTTYRHDANARREFAYFRGPDGKVISGTISLPMGTLLGQRERRRGTKGSRKVGASGAQVAKILGLPAPVYRPSGMCRPGRNISRDEAAAELAKAYASTPALPPVKKCAPGMAAGCADLAAGFWCLRRVRPMPRTTGWTDQFAESSTWRAVLAAVPDETRAILAAARTARSFGDIGKAAGYRGAYARKAGRRLLIAANENFAEIEKKMTA
ncbi:hypothetical protein M1D80_09450 [Phyllobacteriaceae bacterium JZ32]